MAKKFASQGDMTEKEISFTQVGDGLYAFTAEIPHVNALTVEVVLSDGVFFPARRPVIAAVPSTPRTGTA